MHKLLRRQLKRHTGMDDVLALPAQWRDFVVAVDAAYAQNDEDRILLERSLELISKELMERYAELEKSGARRLMARNAELQRSNSDLEQLAYVASHDLQEPLRMITSYIQLLERRLQGQLDEKATRHMSYIVDGAKRMRALINDLLAYARVGRGSQSQPIGEIPCGQLMDDVSMNLKMIIRESNAKIVVKPLPTVLGNRTQLLQLLENLVGNALKYRGQIAPIIEVSAESDGEHWRFAVRDNGIGIEQAHFDRIFQIFQRLHNRGEYTGNGIGLSIARKIVERHRGKIWLESKLGEGTTFFFTLAKDGPANETVE